MCSLGTCQIKIRTCPNWRKYRSKRLKKHIQHCVLLTCWLCVYTFCSGSVSEKSHFFLISLSFVCKPLCQWGIEHWEGKCVGARRWRHECVKRKNCETCLLSLNCNLDTIIISHVGTSSIDMHIHMNIHKILARWFDKNNLCSLTHKHTNRRLGPVSRTS